MEPTFAGATVVKFQLLLGLSNSSLSLSLSLSLSDALLSTPAKRRMQTATFREKLNKYSPHHHHHHHHRPMRRSLASFTGSVTCFTFCTYLIHSCRPINRLSCGSTRLPVCFGYCSASTCNGNNTSKLNIKLLVRLVNLPKRTAPV